MEEEKGVKLVGISTEGKEVELHCRISIVTYARRAINFPRTQLKTIDLSQLHEHPDISVVILNDVKVEYLDLTPLASFKNLTDLYLREMGLKTLDLSPLSSCVNLEVLSISDNPYHEIDLSPLGSCPKFKELHMRSTNVRHVDLSPLRFDQEGWQIVLNHNNLTEIDLTPLTNAVYGRDISLHGNAIKEIDLTPLSTCKGVQIIHIEAEQLDITPLVFMDWQSQLFLGAKDRVCRMNFDLFSLLSPDGVYTLKDSIRFEEDPKKPFSSFVDAIQIVQGRPSQVIVQNVLLFLMGLDHIGVVEEDISKEIRLLDSEFPFEEVKRKIEVSAVSAMCTQIDNGGTTLGLDIEKCSTYAEISRRVPKILELRKEEALKIQISDIYEKGLMPIWNTAYGFEILTALDADVKVRHPKRGEEDTLTPRIMESFEQLGFPIVMVNRPEDLGNQSEGLRLFVRKLVARRNWIYPWTYRPSEEDRRKPSSILLRSTGKT